jgi:nucleoside-diphosphate-sugar epimerase
VKQLIDGEEIKIFGDGNQIRDFNYIDDAVEAFLIAGASEKSFGNFYNLGGTERTSLKDLVEIMIDINGRGSYSIIPFPEERKKIDIGDFYSDFKKIKNELGWKPEVPLREGLQKTFDYYKKYQGYYF